MEYSIKSIPCKDGKAREAVVNALGRIVTFDPLLVYLVKSFNSKEGIK